MKFGLKIYRPIQMSEPQEGHVLQIVGDAAIASVNVGHGKLIPLVILDTTERPDIEEIIKAHDHFDEGDVTIQWGALKNWPKHVALIAYFKRPIERTAVIVFEISKHGVLVEHALLSGALYIQAGRTGDRLKHDLEKSKMILEIPDTGFYDIWSKLYFDSIFNRLKAEGRSKKQAKEATHNIIKSIRNLASIRAR